MDESWAAIEPQVPQNQLGARRVDDRRVISSIIDMLKCGGRWHEVPPEHGAPFGVFITAQFPTRAMERDAAAVGVWTHEQTGRRHPRLQILTLAELFQGKRPDIPWVDASVQKQAKREEAGTQGRLI